MADAESASTWRQAAVRSLLAAEAKRRPIEPLSSTRPGFSAAEAYAIQEDLVGEKIKGGAAAIGWKAGFTSRAMREQMGVEEPNYGQLLDTMLVAGRLSVDELIRPRVEPEIALVLGQTLSGPGVGPEAALDATAWVSPCIEVVDSHFKDYRFQAADNTADNSSAARLVIGESRFGPGEFDLQLIGVVLERSGSVLETGAGAAALGHPARSLAWLANKLAERERQLNRGDIVITGGLTAAPFVRRGDEILAAFDRLGEVRFTAV